MKSLISKLISTSLALTLAGCAFDKENGLEVNKGLLRQNEAINQYYGPLVGTYTGTMMANSSRRASRAEDVELRILITEENVVNADGSPGSKRVPIAYFKRFKPVIAVYQMKLSYSPETGNVNLMSQKEVKDMTAYDIKSLALRSEGSRMTGKVSTVSGIIGNLDINRISTEANAPADGGNSDVRDSYYDLFSDLAGRYEGEIVNPNPKVKNRPVAIQLSLFNPADSIPYLSGIFFPLDAVGAGLDLPLTIEYNPYDEDEPKISMKGASNVVGSTYVLTIIGTIKDGVIIADITNLHQGYLGVMTLKKVKPVKR